MADWPPHHLAQQALDPQGAGHQGRRARARCGGGISPTRWSTNRTATCEWTTCDTALADGVVNESPLYDVDLIDYCLRLPPELAFDSRFDRPMAREATRGWLPEQVRLQTKKANFTPFFEDAMTSADTDGIGRLLEAPHAEVGEYADLDWVRTHRRSLSADGGDPRWIGTVWRLAAGECWLRAQADPGFLDQMLERRDVPAEEVRRKSAIGDGGT